MLSRRIYYILKPFLPWSLRMALRRVRAKRLLKKHANTWPIDESAARPPENWPGWPQGKKFAFVLTHDVEGPEGVAKVRKLAELEMEYGFRSSFNFIPEGGYRVPDELRHWLTAKGFEVGVHDLNHDGKLFDGHHVFKAKAERINKYIADWGAVGFRAGFMLRNLDWYHHLNVQYDASTFDTDPFEPQPENAGTIFPFWIPRPALASWERLRPEAPATREGLPSEASAKDGYVELPYTLPQDSTLFLVLRENSPAIWLRKLDWVASHGGLALVNVHPDYVRFEGEAPSPKTFTESHYRDLLRHARDNYQAETWSALPREIARFIKSMREPPVNKRPKRICMLTHSYYEADNRVVRYAEALAARGDQVDVISLQRSPQTPNEEIINQVFVHRIVGRFGRNEKTKLDYFWPWLKFFLKAASWLSSKSRCQRYDVIHVHNMPDFLVFAAVHPWLKGTPVILDIHDIMPEFYESKFGARRSRLISWLLLVLERLSAKFASHVILSNHIWLEKYARRTGTGDRCSVFINNVNSKLFVPRPHAYNPASPLIMFPGSLSRHQGLDIALRAFLIVTKQIPGARFHIYGEGKMKQDLIDLATQLGLDGKACFFEPVSVDEVARLMATADLGVVPKRADSFGNEAYSTKIMEFMSVGVPVVVSRTKIDQYYFDDSVVTFFDSGDHEAMGAAMLDLLGDHVRRHRQVVQALAYGARNNWDSRKFDYFGLIDSLIVNGQLQKAEG